MSFSRICSFAVMKFFISNKIMRHVHIHFFVFCFMKSTYLRDKCLQLFSNFKHLVAMDVRVIFAHHIMRHHVFQMKNNWKLSSIHLIVTLVCYIFRITLKWRKFSELTWNSSEWEKSLYWNHKWKMDLLCISSSSQNNH